MKLAARTCLERKRDREEKREREREIPRNVLRITKNAQRPVPQLLFPLFAPCQTNKQTPQKLCSTWKKKKKKKKKEKKNSPQLQQRLSFRTLKTTLSKGNSYLVSTRSPFSSFFFFFSPEYSEQLPSNGEKEKEKEKTGRGEKIRDPGEKKKGWQLHLAWQSRENLVKKR